MKQPFLQKSILQYSTSVLRRENSVSRSPSSSPINFNCSTLSPISLTITQPFRKPLLKWAGGKRWLVPLLKRIWDSNANNTIRLVEPFAGGMAVALGLNPTKALLNDANEHIINFYQQVKNGFEISKKLQNSREYYYKAREQFNSLVRQNKHLTTEAAALFYFLIRTGYNGLCRFNSEGKFNVPFGQHENIRYKTDFLEYQSVLQSWDFISKDFQKLKLKKNDFIYADPPYDVAFTKYNKQDFKWDDQCRLAEWLSKHSGSVVASNQATERIIALYQSFNFEVFILQAPRSISCTGDRSPVYEVLAAKGEEPVKFLRQYNSNLKNILVRK